VTGVTPMLIDSYGSRWFSWSPAIVLSHVEPAR